MNGRYLDNLAILNELKSLQQSAGFENDERLSRLIDNIALAGDSDSFIEVKERLERWIIKRMKDRSGLPVPQQEQMLGEFPMALTENKGIFCIDREDVLRNILIAGQAGSGKTNLNFLMMRQLRGHVPFWIFDFAKREYRALARVNDILVIRPEELRFNILRPPTGVSPKEWLATFCSAFSESFSLMTGSEGFLYTEASKLFKIFGVWEGSDTYPTINDLLAFLEHNNYGYRTKEHGYWEVCVNRLRNMSRSLGAMVDCDKDFMPSLIGQNIVFEMAGLPEEMKTFLANLVLLWMFTYRISYANEKTDNFVLAVFIDEASRLFDIKREKRVEQPIPYIDMLAKQMRATGIGLIVSDQEPSRLAYSIKANAGIRICFSLASGWDIMDMATSLDLSDKERSVLKNLGIGVAVVKRSFGYTKPFMIRIPKIDQPRNVTNRELDRINSHQLATLRTQVTEPSDNLKDWKKKKSATGDLSVKHQQFLESVCDIPLLPAGERMARLGWVTYTENKIRRELIAWEYVYEVEINTGGRGGRLKIAELTPKGREYLEKQGKKIIRHGKGSVEHQFWQDRIKRMLEARKWQACIEKRMGKASIDVYGEIRGFGRMAIEISLTTEEHQIESIRKDLESEINWLVVASNDTDVLEIVRRMCDNSLNEKDLERINFCQVTEIESLLDSNFWDKHRNRNQK